MPSRAPPRSTGPVLLRNVVSILGSDVFNKVTTFLLYVLVGRYLGQREFGQLSTALALFYVFQVLASGGLKALMTRQVAADPTSSGGCLVEGTRVAAVFSLLAIGACVGFVGAAGYPADTTLVVLLTALALLPYALTAVYEGVLQGLEEMHLILYATVPAHLLKVGLGFVLLEMGAGLQPVVLLLVVCYAAVAAVELALLTRRTTRSTARVTRTRLLETARASRTFLGVDILVAILTSMNVVLLSLMEGEEIAGLYGAASQMLVPITMIYQNTALALFPTMARLSTVSLDEVTRLVRRVGEVLIGMGLLFAFPLSVVGESVLSLVYGSEFAQAATALEVLAWTVVFFGATAAFGHALYARHREGVNLRIVAFDVVLALPLGLVLISEFGLAGAAVSLLALRVVDFALHAVAVWRAGIHVGLWSMVSRPAIAGACAALVGMSVARSSSTGVAVASGCVVYLAVLGGLAVRAAGGWRRTRAQLVEARGRLRSATGDS